MPDLNKSLIECITAFKNTLKADSHRVSVLINKLALVRHSGASQFDFYSKDGLIFMTNFDAA